MAAPKSMESLEALLARLRSRGVSDDDEKSDESESYFSSVSDAAVLRFRYRRVEDTAVPEAGGDAVAAGAAASGFKPVAEASEKAIGGGAPVALTSAVLSAIASRAVAERGREGTSPSGPPND